MSLRLMAAQIGRQYQLGGLKLLAFQHKVAGSNPGKGFCTLDQIRQSYMKFSLSAFLLPRLGHYVLVDEALGLEGRLDEVVGIVPPESALERAWRKKFK